MFGYVQESPGKEYQRKSQTYLSYLHISSHIYTCKTVNLPSLHVMFPIMTHCKCKPVQASFSSCLGQLFSKIFNFSCVLLSLLVWLLNAWVSAHLDMVGDHQGKQESKQKLSISCISANIIAYQYPKTFTMKIFLHNEKSKVRASFSSCLGQLFSKIFDFFCVPLPLLVWLLNAWFGLCLECLGITRDTQSEIANASQCKQASAAALDNCFRKSSTSSALLWRSWSDSLMLESVHVWIRSGITRERISKKEPNIPFISAHIIPYLYLQDCQFAILACNVSHNDTLQVQASASKLQQLPWTTVLEDLQLQLRSAFAPGLTP